MPGFCRSCGSPARSVTFPNIGPREVAWLRLLGAFKHQERPKSLSGCGPTQELERLGRRAPTVTVVLPVKSRFPLVRCGDVEARYFDFGPRRVVLVSSIRRLLRQGVDILDHLDSGRGLRQQAGFLLQLALGCLGHRLAELDAAGDDVPVPALRGRSMEDQNLRATPASYE